MGLILFLLFIIIISVMCALVLGDSELKGTIAFSLLALVVVLMLVFSIAPDELGYGRVPENAESFAKRLEVGVVYEVVAIKHTQRDEVVLLVWAPLNEYRAIRVKASDPIPTRFTLINGVPREVAK